jgi:predicted glycosyltransferase
MSVAYFLFHGRLNDFLLQDQKGQIITVLFRERQSVKHLAESLGVPHPEIGQVQVNGWTEPLNIITQDQDHVELVIPGSRGL